MEKVALSEVDALRWFLVQFGAQRRVPKRRNTARERKLLEHAPALQVIRNHIDNDQEFIEQEVLVMAHQFGMIPDPPMEGRSAGQVIKRVLDRWTQDRDFLRLLANSARTTYPELATGIDRWVKIVRS